jgi:hypothetical protein
MDGLIMNITTATVFQTINQDDKLNVTFNTSVPNSSYRGF